MIQSRARTIRGGLLAALVLTSISGCPADDELDDEADSIGGETETETETEDEDDTGDDTTDTTDATDTTETDSTDTDGALSFAADVYPIFMAGCSCHVSNAPGLLAMPNAAVAYSNLVDVASIQVALDRIEPGDPVASHLYKKITSTQAFGDPMPSIGPLLGADELLIVETWILGGALE